MKDSLTCTYVSDLKGWENQEAVLYGTQSIPDNLLLDPQGRIVAKNLRGQDLANKLQEIFSKP